MAGKAEEIGNRIVDGDETLKRRADLKRFMIFSLSSGRLGEFAAWLINTKIQ